MNRLAWIALGLVGIYGCTVPIEHHVNDQQFDAVIRRLDNWTRSFEGAARMITGEVSEWRPALAKLEKDLKEDSLELMDQARDILVNDVRCTGESIMHTAGDQGKAMIDYLEVKLKDNLKALRLAIEETRKEVQQAKINKDKDGIKRALDKLANVKVFPDPVVTGLVPGRVRIKWTSTVPKVLDPIVEIRGWGFERPDGEPRRFKLEIVDNKGNTRACPPQALFATTRYLMQINLATDGIAFDKSDRALVFAIGPLQMDRRSMPIIHDFPMASDCNRCSGKGEITCFKCQGKGVIGVAGKPSFVVKDCDTCGGTGKMTCPHCAGIGKK